MLQKKDNKILFGTKGGFAIANSIFNYPHKIFHVRDLAKQYKCSTTAITAGVNLLKDYNIINVDEGNITTNIQANLDAEAYRNYKLLFNLYKFTRYEIINKLADYFNNPECISIFGSFAKGEDVENSDIDILIISSYEKPNSNDFNKFIDMIKDEFNREINLYILKSLKESADSFKNALANGIVLQGYLKVI